MTATVATNATASTEGFYPILHYAWPMDALPIVSEAIDRSMPEIPASGQNQPEVWHLIFGKPLV